VCVSRSRT